MASSMDVDPPTTEEERNVEFHAVSSEPNLPTKLVQLFHPMYLILPYFLVVTFCY